MCNTCVGRLFRVGRARVRGCAHFGVFGRNAGFWGAIGTRLDRIDETPRSVSRQQERLTMMKALSRIALGGALAAASFSSASAHDIYTGVHGRNGQLCCGGDDCAATFYRERGDGFEFLTRERQWITIPAERITFLPIPGDPPNDDSHHAHLCYRSATDDDRAGLASSNVFEGIFLYCAFIPPGSI
jgi:hypothetical protein